MTEYKNLSGDSGIRAYHIETHSIKIEFEDGVYIYNEKRPGIEHVEKMKSLALLGRGLCSYVSQHVKKNYFKKLES